ncbi:hypothetical protein C8J56DRAFT_990632, partial [Mycena floridula]
MALDSTHTSLMALKESSDAFPPLKSAVGSVLALWDIVQQTQSYKALGKDLACRCVIILETIADAVQPDPKKINPEMLKNIGRFKMLVTEISQELSEHNRATRLSRLANLNRHQAQLAFFSWKLKPKPKLKTVFSRSHPMALDIARTSLMALKESSDAFPPLKSAVGSVL